MSEEKNLERLKAFPYHIEPVINFIMEWFYPLEELEKSCYLEKDYGFDYREEFKPIFEKLQEIKEIYELGMKFKINFGSHGRFGHRYNYIKMIQDYHREGNIESRNKWIKFGLNGLKDYSKRTQQRFKKELREMGINWE